MSRLKDKIADIAGAGEPTTQSHPLNWPTAAELTKRVGLPEGYSYVLPTTADVTKLVRAVNEWFPGLAVGAANCFLREEFYRRRVCLDDAEDTPDNKNFFVMLICKGREWAGLLAAECNGDSAILYGRLGVIAKPHRGSGLSRLFPHLLEAMGVNLNMGVVHSMVTLEAPHMQLGFEHAGWQLVGIMPGSDRDVLADGSIKRVYEAIYVKVLVEQTELLRPNNDGMTPVTRNLFELLFGKNNSAQIPH